MKAMCRREELLAAFAMVGGVVPARSPKPILQNVKLVADTPATLLATDLEVAIRFRVLDVRVEEPGAVILPTQRMQQILRAARDADLYIEADGESLLIRGEESEFRLPAEDPDLFPEVPDFAASAYHAIAAADLRRSIRRTIFATDVESTRYALGGVKIELAADRITMVGTDGRRLAMVEADAEAEGGATDSGGSTVVPVKALKLIERNLDDEDPPVHLAVQSDKAVLVRTDRAVIYSRLVEGRFPRYQDVFPATADVKIPMDAGMLLRAVEQASIVTSEESRGVDFSFGNGRLTLSSRAADVGSSRVSMPIDYDGKPVEITFDPRFLTDALKTLGENDRVTAELIDHKNAAVFKTEDRYTYVVMPLTRDR